MLHGSFWWIFLKLLSYLPFIFLKFRSSYIQGKPFPVAASVSCWNYFWKSKQTGSKATRIRTQTKNYVSRDIKEFIRKMLLLFFTDTVFISAKYLVRLFQKMQREHATGVGAWPKAYRYGFIDVNLLLKYI